MSVWTETVFSSQDWVRWEVGPLTLWARNIDDEFHLAMELVDEDHQVDSNKTSFPSDSAEVRRWVLRREPLKCALLPIMPDRPVVVRPDLPICFSPGRSAWIYVSIPVWVRVLARQSDEVVLADEMTRKLSNIWFGDPTDGTLAYSLKSHAQRTLATVEPLVHRAVCPVFIKNISHEDLNFQRLCIRVEHLSIYADENRLWTNEVKVSFRGQNDISQIDYGRTAPSESGDAKLLSAARSPAKKSLFRNSFMSLFRWAGGGQ